MSVVRGVSDSLRTEWRESTRSERMAAIALLVIAVAVRLAHLRQTMRHDEAYTFLHFVSRPFASAISEYGYPNNHLLHTVLAWVTTRLFGDSPIALRLPVFVAGVFVVPAVYLLARRFTDRSASLFAMALTAVWPALVLYSTNARGYSIIFLAFISMLMLGDEVIDTSSPRTWLGVAAAFALGMFTVPIMLYPGGAALLWIAVEKTRRHGIAAARAMLPRFGVTAAVAGALTLLAYLPLMRRAGVESLVSNKYVTPLSPPAFLSTLPSFAGSLHESLVLGVPWPVLGILTAAGVIGMVWPREGRGRRLALALTVLAWSVLLLVAMRRTPPGRVWLFLVPLGCVYAGAGLSLAIDRVASAARVNARVTSGAVAVLFALVFGASVVQRRVVFRTPETGTLADAPAIAAYLLATMRDGDRIVVRNPSDAPLDYYLLRRGGRRLGEINARAASGRVFVVVNPRHLQTLELVKEGARDVPWASLVPDGAPVDFQPETVHLFRRADR